MYGKLVGVFTRTSATNVVNDVFNVNGQQDFHNVSGVLCNASDVVIVNDTFQISAPSTATSTASPPGAPWAAS
jgi:hypothetical protein